MPNKPFSDKQVKLIQDNYGLNITTQELPEWKTASNNVVVLQDIKGVKYVAKKWSEEYSEEVIRSRLRLMDFIYDHGILTPKPLENISGTKLTRSNGDNYVLTTFIPGRKADGLVLEEVAIAFSALAMFNNTLNHFPRLEEFVALPRYSELISVQFKNLEPFLPTQPKNEIDEYVLNNLDYVKATISEVEEKFSNIDHQKKLIHGNFNLGSTLINNSKLAGILDYNLIRIDFRGVDTMHTIDLYCFEKEKEGLKLEDRVNWEKMKKCFGVYKEHDNKIIEQVDDMPLMLAWLGLSSLITTWGRGYLPDQTEKQREYFKNRYNFFINRTRINLGLEQELIKALKEA